MNVLVVEDNADAALALSMLLELEGFGVTVAEGIHAALSKREVAYDAVLSDINLPDGSGLDLVPQFPPTVRFIAMTGMSREAVWNDCAAAGFQDFLQKPVDFDELIKKLRP